ncbi:hypothetical protein CTR2_R33000 [Comamonas thiooxydans]|uniref:hypothetical protein n=1 Tax=Comamonas thiooxydans TaxID=363952 RepID=UPI00111E1E85|nr:hypothetical protein [Comamonas thiooxydans]BDR09962.1 hypothetical protein CTR2_R33000 [Comamonas thiooxydans]
MNPEPARWHVSRIGQAGFWTLASCSATALPSLSGVPTDDLLVGIQARRFSPSFDDSGLEHRHSEIQCAPLKIVIIRQSLRSNPCQLKIDFIKKIYLFTQLLSTATSSRKDDSGTGKAPPQSFKEAHTSDLLYPLARSVSAYILPYILLIQHQSNAMKCQLAGPAASR